jgi:lactate dehydrogenase-like 2-hydroxyacid dehydrogenase
VGAATYQLVNAGGPGSHCSPEGTLINVARGSVVDEGWFWSRRLSTAACVAGLDVCLESEPKVPEVLFGMDQVVLVAARGQRHACDAQASWAISPWTICVRIFRR